MAFFSEIYFSKLVGAAVFDVTGEYVGQFRDFVVQSENGTFAVNKIRVRITKKKRIILPWEDVLSIEILPIVLFKLKRKKRDLKESEYTDEEIRLKRDIMDQQVIDTNNYKVVRVNDLKMIAAKNRIFVVGVDVGFRGLLRRVGWEKFGLTLAKFFHVSLGEKLISAQSVDPFPARIRHDIRLKTEHEKLTHMHPADLAEVITQLDHFEQMTVIRSLDTESLAETISELKPKVRSKLVRRLHDKTLQKVLEKLEPDEAADIVSQFPKSQAYHLMEGMKTKTAEEVRELVQFRADTAGGLMTTKYVVFSPSITAGQALKELREKARDVEMIFHVYCINEEGVLVGAMSLRQLLLADPNALLQTLMQHRTFAVRPSESAERTLHRMTKYNLIAMPVIDNKKRLRGIVTVDDVLAMVNK